MVLMFCIGLGLDLIVVPVIVVIGIPGFIIFTIVEAYKRHKRANENLRIRLAQANINEGMEEL